jgi:hypothetical protein
VNFIRPLEEHRTGRVNGYAAIGVSLRDRAAFYHDHYWTRMYVPSGFGRRLKFQQGLQHIGRSIHAQVAGFIGGGALRLGDDLQWANFLSARTARGDQAQYEGSR